MGYQLTLVRKATIKQSTNNKYWGPCGENKTLLHYWWKCKLLSPLWKTVWRFLKKLKIVTIRSINPTPGHIARKDEHSNLKRYMHPSVHRSTIYNSQDMEAT